MPTKPMQRRARQVGRVGGAACAFDIERRKSSDLGFMARDRLRAEIDHGARRHGAALDPAAEIERGQHGRVSERVLHGGAPERMWPNRRRRIKLHALLTMPQPLKGP
jgi:hypothetical protein